MAWFRGLTGEEQERLEPGCAGPHFPAHHMSMSGEYALCLLGLKPCVVIDHGRWSVIDFGEESFPARPRWWVPALVPERIWSSSWGWLDRTVRWVWIGRYVAVYSVHASFRHASADIAHRMTHYGIQGRVP
jgi:hypothetical protein